MGAQSASRQASGRVNDSVSGECRRLGKGRATATRRRVPSITRRYSLDEVNEAHRALGAGENMRGLLVF